MFLFYSFAAVIGEQVGQLNTHLKLLTSCDDLLVVGYF